jgi:hypothetical protein
LKHSKYKSKVFELKRKDPRLKQIDLHQLELTFRRVIFD